MIFIVSSGCDQVWLLPLAIIVLYKFAVLWEIAGTFFASGTVAGIHGAVRPMANEFYFVRATTKQTQGPLRKTPPVERCDAGDELGEEEVTFTQIDITSGESAEGLRRTCAARRHTAK